MPMLHLEPSQTPYNNNNNCNVQFLFMKHYFNIIILIFTCLLRLILVILIFIKVLLKSANTDVEHGYKIMNMNYLNLMKSKFNLPRL